VDGKGLGVVEAKEEKGSAEAEEMERDGYYVAGPALGSMLGARAHRSMTLSTVREGLTDSARHVLSILNPRSLG
jgi:hypothetical protein